MSPDGFISLREVAEKAGVSVSAVSLALRNSPKVSSARRLVIQRIADELGYKRDPRVSELMEHLRTTRQKRFRAKVAVLVPELTREEVNRHGPVVALISGVRELAERAGFGVDVFHLADPGMSCRKVRSILLARGIKGIVVAPFASGVAKLDFDFEGLYPATAGYSIVEPRLHRACPDYLRMMDEMVETCLTAGCRRIGLVMTYKEGGIGHKLFTSSFLFFQTRIPASERIPILPSPRRDPVHETGPDSESLRTWLETHKPDVVIGTGSVYRSLQKIGVQVPDALGFVSLDVSEEPANATGANHRYDLVGREAFKLVLSRLNLNFTGVPAHPRVVLVDSTLQEGVTLTCPNRRKSRSRKTVRREERVPEPEFRGFIE